MNDIYTLPMDTFIAGQTREYVWELFKSDRTPFSTDGCTAYFSVCNYSDRNSCVLAKSAEIKIKLDGNIVTVNIPSGATENLDGKYIYQLKIEDMDNNVEIMQGVWIVHETIDCDSHKSGR